MSTIAEIVSTMQQKFNPSAAEELDLIFQFEVEDEDSFHLIVREGKLEVNRGDNNEANVTLKMNSDTLDGMITGKTDGMQAFMTGELQASGDMMLATKLTQLFPV
tara:strand:- start:977 stop:1291 length:315 start_codon:yes stop_codon:yes gene_type:complete